MRDGDKTLSQREWRITLSDICSPVIGRTLPRSLIINSEDGFEWYSLFFNKSLVDTILGKKSISYFCTCGFQSESFLAARNAEYNEFKSYTILSTLSWAFSLFIS